MTTLKYEPQLKSPASRYIDFLRAIIGVFDIFDLVIFSELLNMEGKSTDKYDWFMGTLQILQL